MDRFSGFFRRMLLWHAQSVWFNLKPMDQPTDHAMSLFLTQPFVESTWSMRLQLLRPCFLVHGTFPRCTQALFSWHNESDPLVQAQRLWRFDRTWPGSVWYRYMAVCQNLAPLVNIKIAGKWMVIPLKMVLIGIDPYPYRTTIVVHWVSCGHWQQCVAIEVPWVVGSIQMIYHISMGRSWSRLAFVDYVQVGIPKLDPDPLRCKRGMIYTGTY